MGSSHIGKSFRIEKLRLSDDSPDEPVSMSEIRGLIDLMRNEIRALAVPPSVTPGGVDPEAFRQQVVEAERLKSDLQELSEAIERTKQEIISLRGPVQEDDRIATASEALRAVVGDTETATDGIINAAESIEELAGRMRSQVEGDEAIGIVDEILENVTNVFEHCNFQDITGQRITKVVDTMEFIDVRIAKMMDIWGGSSGFQSVTPFEAAPPAAGEKLHGPAMDGDGSISQAEIDALFD